MDLTPLNAWLSSLGPWGIVAAVVVTIAAPRILDWVKKKVPGLTPPGTPPPAPQPGPVDPAPLSPAPLANRPLLNLLLLSLKQTLAVRHPGRDPEQVFAEYLTLKLVAETAEPRASPPPDPLAGP